MSLTNDQITAKNFKEFYEAIRPYLNGGVKANAAGPTMVKLYDGASSASIRRNKILSTDDMIELSESIEHFDFIYIEYCSFKSSDANNPECTKASSITSVEHIKTISGYGGNCIENSTTFFSGNTPYSHRQSFGFYDATHMAKCWEDYSGWSHNTDHIIVYGITAEPRTTYSTTEKIVGTWIDGKPIYQKTWDLGSQVAITTSWATLSQISPSSVNMNKTISVEATKGGDSSSSDNPAVQIWGGVENDSFIAKAPTDVSVRYVTVRYTKTTD